MLDGLFKNCKLMTLRMYLLTLVSTRDEFD